MPIDPGSKFGSTLQLNKKRYNPAYSRSYFLLLNDGKKYDAYILTVIADSSYINNDLTKLDRNTYRKHDPDFSGSVLYFTPKGTYIGGYGYKNGQLIGPETGTTQTNTPRVQSTEPGGLTTNTMKQVCTDWYIVYFVDGVYVDDEYLTTTCTMVDDGQTGGSGGGSAPPPPVPCPPGSHTGPPVKRPCIPRAVDAIEENAASVNNIPIPPGDGGLPPPPQATCVVDPPAEPCPVEDPCATMKKLKAKFATAFNMQRNAAVLAKPGTDEYGSDLNLTSIISTTYKNTSITTFGQSSWQPHFTWNSTNGFTVGSVHRHQAAGPSPDDVFSLIANLYNAEYLASSPTSKKFYMDNAYATIVTGTNTYVINVSNWATLREMYEDCNKDRVGYSTTFQSRATKWQKDNNVDEATATIKVLLDMFAGIVNLYKRPTGTINYTITSVDQNGKVIVTSCPN